MDGEGKVPALPAAVDLTKLAEEMGGSMGAWSSFYGRDFLIVAIGIKKDFDDQGEEFLELKITAAPLVKYRDALKCDAEGSPCT